MAGLDDNDIGLWSPEFLDSLVWRPEPQSVELLGDAAGNQPIADEEAPPAAAPSRSAKRKGPSG